MILTSSQNKVVKKLFLAFQKKEDEKYKVVSFKAPTGAGKTFIASEFISRVFAHEFGKNLKTIFVVATVSSAKLPKQFAKKLKKYKKYHKFNNYSIEHIASPSSLKNNRVEDLYEPILENQKIYVFGTSSFGKRTLFYQNKTLNTFLQQAQSQGYQIFFIRDEAHIGKKETISKQELKTFDALMFAYSSFIIQMTATPKDKNNLITMSKEDMEEDDKYLLKQNMKKTKLYGEIDNEMIIDDAISEFLQSKKDYQKLKEVIINPAMLVQVMNEADYNKNPIRNEQFHTTLQFLEKKLQAAGLKYLKYLNRPEVVGAKLPNTLEYASQLDAGIDVIIFKVGPATGWDIPRANMLLQLRNVSSEFLNMQTLGRIMRNPYPNLEKHPTTNKYYIWSNYQKSTREEAYYQIKNQFRNENFFTGKIDKVNQTIQLENKSYCKAVSRYLKDVSFENKIKDLDIENDVIYDFTNYGQAKVLHKIPNHLYLKIYNLELCQKYEKKFQINHFNDIFFHLSQSLDVNIELVKYCFFTSLPEINKIKNFHTSWTESLEPYLLLKDAQPQKNYTIWVDNKNEPKAIDTKNFENYGYIQIGENVEEYKQYLDSEPERKFFNIFNDVISYEQRKNIHFFAKMPSLGSQVSFDYYSQEHGLITRSYIDFAIIFKKTIIMIEVKSKDSDYNPEKTKELISAYTIYMKKFQNRKLHLVLFEYDKKNKNMNLQRYLDGKWQTNLSFRETFDCLLK